MVRAGKSIREVARHTGFNASTISRWNRKVPKHGAYYLPTQSSRPHNHPKQLKSDVTRRIVELRTELKGRCAEVIYQHMLREGIKVSLSSVKRTLDRRGLTKKKTPWKEFHKPLLRPDVANPGDLVEIDTIHLMKNESQRMYIYTLLDVHSRWAYAKAFEKLSNLNTLKFMKEALGLAPLKFSCLQSDRGPEFSKLFTKKIKIIHRHTRIRKPNDNGHLERFNRTLQDELVSSLPINVRAINKQLPEYLNYYNTRRLHMGLNFKTPAEVLQSY
jgi:transposase InsO family protein